MKILSKNQVVQNIIFLAKDFFVLKEKSPYQLLEKSGYFEFYNQINENDLFQELKKHPELIKFWLNYSSNPRSDGWYLYEENGIYQVGYETQNQTIEPVIFNDSFKACTMYIMREIEIIRKI